jgi:hypothetical protein
MNQKEIAKNICVLRKVKNNSCQGHCALKKELKKEAENEKKSGTILKEKAEILCTLSDSKLTIPHLFSIVATKQVWLTYSKKPISVSFAIFHPPTV